MIKKIINPLKKELAKYKSGIDNKAFRSVNRTYKLARIWSNSELRKVAWLFEGNIVNVSGSDDKDKEGGYYENYFCNKNSYVISNFTGDKGHKERTNEILLDITSHLPEDLVHRFDVVFNHTMLEHVFDVFTAFKNLCELSKDIVIIVVPFAQIQHAIDKSYDDYWRFTPPTIRQLFAINHFEVVYEAESPDKDAAIYLFFVASRNPEKWINVLPDYKPIDRAGSWIGA